MSAEQFSEKHKVLYYETDVTGRITLEMLVNILILASEDQSNQLELSNSTILEKYGVGWVVTSYSIDINRLPKAEKIVNTVTRGTSANKLFAYREFWLRDEVGNDLVKASSTWIVMDESKRKLTKIPEALLAKYKSTLVRRIPRLPRPKRMPEGTLPTEKQYQVRYSDIDFNGHVNNAHYLGWFIDPLKMDFLGTHNPKHVDIRFENEVTYGTMVTSSFIQHELDNGQIETVHEIRTNDGLAASATFTWEKRSEREAE